MDAQSSFLAVINQMENISLLSDDDEDEDLVKLCGIDDERDHGREFCDGEPLEPPQAFATASTSEDSFEEDQEFLELQEREQIVDKYERGPDQTDVDPWENPDFELYKITDRYGFMHKKIAPEQTEEQKRVQKELKREQKWLRMLKEWEQRHPNKLAERMWKGVPDTLRLVIWKRLIGADTMRANSRENLYNELLARARLVSKDIKQIDLDINRTYRDNLAFRRRYDVKQRSLFNVLTAYAMLNTEVGYCQGMSQIAALFLMYMDEEEAFWSLHGLLVNRKYGMHGFFVPGFPKLQRFQNHYDKVLLKYLPRVKRHLDNIGIPPIYLTKWWFGCFLDRVPFPLALRLWDAFLYFGDCILIAMAYNIMKMHRKRIVKLSVEDFMEFIQNSLARDFGFPDDAVMESLGECLKRLQNDRMAIPPPANPTETAELPTKPLGPILTRSMMDIRSDIDSVYSRCSRANSVTGRSPKVRRHFTQHIPPANHQKVISALAFSRIQSQSQHSTPNASSPLALHGADADGSRPGSLKSRGCHQHGPSADNDRFVAAMHGNVSVAATTSHAIDADTASSSPASAAVGPPVEPFLRRVGSTKHRIQRPPPVPDEDGFVRMGPRSIKQQHEHHQQQQNVEEGGAARDERGDNYHSAMAQSHRHYNQNDGKVSAQPQPKRTAPGTMTNNHNSGINNTSYNEGTADGSGFKKVPMASKLPQPRSSSLKNTPSMSPQHGQRHIRRDHKQKHKEQMLFGTNSCPTPAEHRQQRSEGGGISGGRHRVHRAANNVTYISVDADDEGVNAATEIQQQQNKRCHSSAPPPPPQWHHHQNNDGDQQQHRPAVEERQRMPSRLPYHCPLPDYDMENGNNGGAAKTHANMGSPRYGRNNGGTRMGSRMKSVAQQPQQQKQLRPTATTSFVVEGQPPPLPSDGSSRNKTVTQSEPMAVPLFAQNETRVVRRF